MIDLVLDSEEIDKLENEDQKAFFHDIKNKLDNNEAVDPFDFLNNLSALTGGEDNPELIKLRKLNETLNAVIKPLQNIKL